MLAPTHFQIPAMNANLQAQPGPKLTQLLLACMLFAFGLSAARAGVPGAATQPPTDITSTSATLNGLVNPNDEDTDVVFEYGLDITYGSATDPVTLSATNRAVPVRAGISNLQMGVTYHFRVVASNGSGETRSPDWSFTTLGPTPCADGPCYEQNLRLFNLNYALYLKYANTTWAYSYYFLGRAVPYLDYYYAGFFGNNFCCVGNKGALSGVGSSYFDYYAGLGDYYWKTY